MDEPNAQAMRHVDGGDGGLLAREFDRAGVRLVHATQDFDQSRFAGAIFAQESVNLART